MRAPHGTGVLHPGVPALCNPAGTGRTRLRYNVERGSSRHPLNGKPPSICRGGQQRVRIDRERLYRSSLREGAETGVAMATGSSVGTRQPTTRFPLLIRTGHAEGGAWGFLFLPGSCLLLPPADNAGQPAVPEPAEEVVRDDQDGDDNKKPFGLEERPDILAPGEVPGVGEVVA